MANIILIIHLILALALIAVVLLQRSEGGALGIGGGGGGLVSARGAATALSKVTWMLAVGFLCTSMLLTMLSDGGTGSVFDGQQIPGAPAVEEIDPLLGPPPASTGEGGVPLPSAPAQ
ncbi:MAG: preprotein translocase subunit SecG [Pseudomonadota bacterium]